MKKWIAIVLVVCVLTAGNSTCVVNAFSYALFDVYYYNLFRTGGMANGAPTLIGDPTSDDTINAFDALLTLKHSLTENVLGGRTPGKNEKQANIAREYCSYEFWKFHYHEELEDYKWEDVRGNIIMHHSIYKWYVWDSYFVCDVTNDCEVTAEDALMILQYAVGKRESFTRTDYSGEGGFQYMVWPTEWYPTMYMDLRTRPNFGEDIYDDIADDFPDIPPMAKE